MEKGGFDLHKVVLEESYSFIGDQVDGVKQKLLFEKQYMWFYNGDFVIYAVKYQIFISNIKCLSYMWNL